MDYSRAAAASLKMLTAFGKTATLRSTTPGEYDTATSTVSGPTISDESRKIVLLPYDRLRSGELARDNSSIRSIEVRCLMEANGSAPSLSDTIVEGANTWTIIEIKGLNPAGTPVLYDMVLRR